MGALSKISSGGTKEQMIKKSGKGLEMLNQELQEMVNGVWNGSKPYLTRICRLGYLGMTEFTGDMALERKGGLA